MRTRLIRSSSDSVPPAPSIRHGAQKHRSVLLHEATEALAIAPSDTILDATLGGAGHAEAIAARLDHSGTFIGFDLDAEAIERAGKALKGCLARQFFIEANFRRLALELEARGIKGIDKALFDLGWSSHQLDAGRGFSFLKDEPLLMTFARSASGLTAATIVNEWDESSIADVIYGWGEERYARRIAKAIVNRRAVKPIMTSRDLGEIVRSAVPSAYRRGKLHPATKTFQALRIAVNDELGSLAEGLQGAWKMLKPDGRIAVITFHSIEDRIVKELFLQLERQAAGSRVTRSPVKPSAEEVAQNPRSRSAKLRVIEKN